MSAPLPSATGRQTVRALERAGFVLARTRGSHQILAFSDDPARVVIVPLHGSRDLRPGTLRAIIRQSGLSVAEFKALL